MSKNNDKWVLRYNYLFLQNTKDFLVLDSNNVTSIACYENHAKPDNIRMIAFLHRFFSSKNRMMKNPLISNAKYI